MSMIRDNGVIIMSRGDTFSAPLFVNIGTDDAPVRVDFNKFHDMDVVFQIVTYEATPREVFSKTFTYKDANELGDVVITLTKEDLTDLLAGVYNYTVTGTMFDETTQEVFMYTIVPVTTIMIM